MIDFKTIKEGERLRVVGAGAPGFANVGDFVTVTSCNGANRVDVARADGETAYFALTCGAARLEPVTEPKTVADLLKLPVFVMFSQRVTKGEDGGVVHIPVTNTTLSFFAEADTKLLATDAEGVCWRLCRDPHGWCREKTL